MAKLDVQKLIEQGLSEDEIDRLLTEEAIRDKHKRTTWAQLKRIMRRKDRREKRNRKERQEE